MRIVATAEVPTVARRAFAPLGEILVRVAAYEPETEVLIVRGTRVDAETLALLPDLRAIARTGAGYDNLDVVEATRRGVPIVYAPGVGSQPVAEGTVALMLAAAKRLRELGAVVERAAWASRYEVAGLDIEGACLGIVGYGSIGRRVGRLCRGLGMEVIAYDPALEPFAEPQIELVALEELLERADVISLHCGLTGELVGSSTDGCWRASSRARCSSTSRAGRSSRARTRSPTPWRAATSRRWRSTCSRASRPRRGTASTPTRA